ncbi:MAG: FUSC family protein [Pseudonocardia sp.]|nr:FUSC family protein [Pseudonocardia sp.]
MKLLAELRPRPGRWGVVPGICALIAAAVVLGGAVAVGNLSVGGIAYLGVACAASFVGGGGTRSRAARVAAQAAGAAAGMTVGALIPATAAWVIAAAVFVGALAGALGRIGPATTGAAVMAVIGLAYTQFGRVGMPWWEPVLAYLFGSAVLLVPALVAGRHADRQAVSAVFDAAGDLLAAPDDDAARHRLAATWASAREAAAGYRLRPGPLAEAWAGARDAADQAARLAARPSDAGLEARVELGRRWRASAAALRERGPARRPADGQVRPGPGAAPEPDPTTAPGATTGPSAARRGPWRRGPAFTASARAVLQRVVEPLALWTGARIGVCVGLATAVAILLRTPAHAFWIPLTVAVVVRPEYGSVLVRSLHRLVGTVLGVTVVAILLALNPSPTWITAIAAVSLGLASFGAPRLYALAVVGITGSALLSVALSTPVGFDPWARLVDTVVGCCVALVAGVLAWPRRGLPDQPRAFAQATAALAAYADRTPADPRLTDPRLIDEAYQRAHDWRAQLDRDLSEPDPTQTASDWLPVAHRLEHLVDAVVATTDPARRADTGALLQSRVHTAAEATALLAQVTQRLR